MNKEVKAYIESNCANHDADGMCLLESASNGSRLCPFFFEIGKKCIYAETSVLPGDTRIQALYMAGKKSARALYHCAECGKPIEKKSNATKYCPACMISVRQRRQRIYKASKRVEFYNKDA